MKKKSERPDSLLQAIAKIARRVEALEAEVQTSAPLPTKSPLATKHASEPANSVEIMMGRISDCTQRIRRMIGVAREIADSAFGPQPEAPSVSGTESHPSDLSSAISAHEMALELLLDQLSRLHPNVRS